MQVLFKCAGNESLSGCGASRQTVVLPDPQNIWGVYPYDRVRRVAVAY